MESGVLHTAVFAGLFFIFMANQRTECYPYKWPQFYSPTDETPRVEHSTYADTQETSNSNGDVNTYFGPGNGRDTDTTLGTEVREIDRNRGEKRLTADDDNDEETRRLIDEIFRTPTQDPEDPTVTKIRMSGDDANLRRFDFKDKITPSSVTSYNTGDKIVFPEDTGTTGPKRLTKVPTCRGKTFCEEIPYYPTELVSRALGSNTDLNYLQIVDELEPPVIGERISVDDDALCTSTERIVTPKSALSKTKGWLFVLNNDNFTQAVRVEVCKAEDSPCEIISDWTDGYRTTCKQKYIYRQLMAIRPTETIGPELFSFPSSCCCHVKFTGNVLGRAGINDGKNNTWTTMDQST